jgi:hypothetical protein
MIRVSKYSKFFHLSLSVLALGATLCWSSPASAAAIGNPSLGNGWSTTDAVSIGAHSGEAANREIINMINGSGISGTNGELHNFDEFVFGNMSLFRGNTGAHAGTVAGSHWARFEFDQAYPLGDMWLWNWKEAAFPAFGWKHLTVQYSLTGGANPSDWTTIYDSSVDGLLPQAVDSSVDLVVDFGGALAQYVVLTNTGALGSAEENWSNGAFLNDAGLSEVRFNVIPEPGSLGMAATAFCSLFLMLRRKRKLN